MANDLIAQPGKGLVLDAERLMPSWLISLVAGLKTPRDLTTGSPSFQSWVAPRSLPTKSQLEQALELYERWLTPSGAQGVADVLSHLHLVTVAPSTDGMTELEIRDFLVAQVGAYAAHVGHVPLGILRKAAKACADASRWLPKPAELLEHATPALLERRAQRDRLAKLIANYDAPKLEAKRYEREPDDERLAGIIRSYRKHGNHRRADELEQEFQNTYGRPSGVPMPAAPAAAPEAQAALAL